MTAHAGEDAEKAEHLLIAAGHANLYSHYGNQYGSLSGTWELIYCKIQLENNYAEWYNLRAKNNNNLPTNIDFFLFHVDVSFKPSICIL